MTSHSEHIPVMVKECLKGFEGCELFTFFEGTVGAGGHAEAILEAHPEINRYLGCDQDPVALAIAKKRLAPWKDKVELIHGNFRNLGTMLAQRRIAEVNGFFLTLECHQCNSIKERGGLVL